VRGEGGLAGCPSAPHQQALRAENWQDKIHSKRQRLEDRK
jgi:hypothetical protein